jgi:hypothetical protein
VFDYQHNLWTNVFASIYVYSSEDVEWTWTKALRKQHLKKDIRRLIKDLPTSSEVQDTRQENPKWRNFKDRRLGCFCVHQTIRWYTGPRHQTNHVESVYSASEPPGTLDWVWCTPAARRTLEAQRPAMASSNGFLSGRHWIIWCISDL